VANTTIDAGTLWSSPPHPSVSSSGWATKISGRLNSSIVIGDFCHRWDDSAISLLAVAAQTRNSIRGTPLEDYM